MTFQPGDRGNRTVQLKRVSGGLAALIGMRPRIAFITVVGAVRLGAPSRSAQHRLQRLRRADWSSRLRKRITPMARPGS